ncbi:exodeoxyribonuclease VII small subunit [Streptomyces sp. WMMB 322]|uniref:exodeoxyribonuclease VII small subunit n=1 Tax=Streptomyces sp. WMMB 322 TaxID=1286821 RepID=UPI0006E30ED3|nr:exodeoxyribonuclease VII small subunit [Streptomyces sp. WMMB 322]SCK26156.1 Exodeoxyribonuclease VII small subunit [Streptomyces sp. WMMB 322]
MTSDTGTESGVETDREQVRSALSYEQARGELVRVVQQLEAGGATLEESLALWERGEELARVCREWLEGARARLDAVLEAEAEAGEDADPDAAAEAESGPLGADEAEEAEGAGDGR